MDIVSEKKLLRQRIKEKIKSLTVDERRRQSEGIYKNLTDHPVWRESRKILLYASMDFEVDTWALIKKGLQEEKTIGLPFYIEVCDIYKPRIIRDINKDLRIGKLGIKEPNENCMEMPVGEFDLIIVPGLAFSMSGYRLGRGKGYYDKLLTQATGKKCGICFECQIVDELPVENHDVKMNYVITPSLIVEFK